VTIIRPEAEETPKEARIGFGLLGRMIARAMADEPEGMSPDSPERLLRLAKRREET